MKKKYLSLIKVSILLLLFVSQALAQTTGKIAGQVHDKRTGEPLPGGPR